MSMPEDLVPPLEKCKRIPAGEFAYSALVFARLFTGHTLIVPREEAAKNGWDITVPAPTLEEILRELTACGLDEPAVSFDGDHWIAYCDFYSTGGPITPVASDSGAGAALRLWMQFRGIGD